MRIIWLYSKEECGHGLTASNPTFDPHDRIVFEVLPARPRCGSGLLFSTMLDSMVFSCYKISISLKTPAGAFFCHPRQKWRKPHHPFFLEVCSFEHLWVVLACSIHPQYRVVYLDGAGLPLSQGTAPHFLVGRSIEESVMRQWIALVWPYTLVAISVIGFVYMALVGRF